MFIKNCWYVAAWSSEVATTSPFSRTLLGTPIVFWRDSSNNIVAFEDMCCHRGAPLSKGRIEESGLRCMYHGLLFNESGECIEIPGQDRIPPKVRAKKFPVVEKHKWIWIWMGDPEKADPDTIPATPWLDHPDWKSLEGYTHYDTNYLLITDNLLDLAHIPYVHADTLGGDEAYAACTPEITRLENGLKITRWGEGIKPAPFLKGVKDFPGLVDRWNIYNFTLPAIFLMDSGMQPTGHGAKEGNRYDAAEFRSTQALTPETEESTHYFFAQPHNFAIDRPEITESIHKSVIAAFEEDRQMIQAQNRFLKIKPDFEMVSIGADSALSYFRWLVSKTIKAEQEEKPTVQTHEVTS